MAWTYLVIAGVLEVVWAVGLKYTDGFTKPLASIITGAAMIVSFICLSQALRTLPVGTGYAIWTGIGAVGTAMVGIFFLGESKDPARVICLMLIVAGILGLKLTSTH